MMNMGLGPLDFGQIPEQQAPNDPSLKTKAQKDAEGAGIIKSIATLGLGGIAGGGGAGATAGAAEGGSEAAAAGPGVMSGGQEATDAAAPSMNLGQTLGSFGGAGNAQSFGDNGEEQPGAGKVGAGAGDPFSLNGLLQGMGASSTAMDAQQQMQTMMKSQTGQAINALINDQQPMSEKAKMFQQLFH